MTGGETPPQAGATPSPIVTGATVTVVVIGDSIVRSARIITAELAKQGGKAPAAAANNTVQTRPHRLPNMEKQDILSWQQLLDQGAVAKLHISIGEANKMLEQNNPAAAEKPEPGNPEDTFINLYTAVVSQPSIGKSLLGEQGYERLKGSLKPNQAAIIVAGEGVYSWKGSGYVRGGIFDRIEVVQNDNGFRFTDAQHTRLLKLEAAGAPEFKEVSLFVIPENEELDAADRLQEGQVRAGCAGVLRDV